MSDICLLVEVHLHDNRWHGAGEWPPSPFRLFQALVAAAFLGRGENPTADEIGALAWLAILNAPVIAAPASKRGGATTLYVPNNDLDAVGGDPGKVDKIRAGKTIRPYLLDQNVPFLYVWTFEGDTIHAETMTGLADRLYQFGRGVDMAFARAEVAGREAVEARLADRPVPVWRPAGRGPQGVQLRCPDQDTLQSLRSRHAAQIGRLKEGVLRQAPQPRFRMVGYNCPPTRLLFDLKAPDPQRRFQSWPLTRTADLATSVRDGAVLRLKNGLPLDAGKIERTLIGRNATEADKAIRVRIVPLPSIGSPNTDPSIRRLLVEIPPDCPIRADDLLWAFSGLDLGADHETGEVVREGQAVLASSEDRSMLRHYGVEGEASARVWRTVTPAALPVHRPRGRASGTDRLANDSEAAHAARQALRHAAIATPIETIRVQREPYFEKGARAEAFADGSRIEFVRLWHVEVAFADLLSGPLVIGDGRYFGLGLMAPIMDRFRDALILWIRKDLRPPLAHRAAVVGALRRALMSREKDATGQVSILFSGHESDPGPARSGRHRHAFLLADDSDGDGLLDRIAVIAPWRVDRSWTPRREDRALFENIASGLSVVRAGAAGVLALGPAREPDAADPLFVRARTWTSRTPYLPTRHARKRVDAETATADDLVRECLRRGLPRPGIEVTRIEAGPRGGIRAEARLRFAVAVAGPILLGCDAHRGGGLFAGEHGMPSALPTA